MITKSIDLALAPPKAGENKYRDRENKLTSKVYLFRKRQTSAGINYPPCYGMWWLVNVYLFARSAHFGPAHVVVARVWSVDHILNHNKHYLGMNINIWKGKQTPQIEFPKESFSAVFLESPYLEFAQQEYCHIKVRFYGFDENNVSLRFYSLEGSKSLFKWGN